jgi:hypothetical protein
LCFFGTFEQNRHRFWRPFPDFFADSANGAFASLLTDQNPFYDSVVPLSKFPQWNQRISLTHFGKCKSAPKPNFLRWVAEIAKQYAMRFLSMISSWIVFA